MGGGDGRSGGHGGVKWRRLYLNNKINKFKKLSSKKAVHIF